MRIEQLAAEALDKVGNDRYLLATAVAKRVEQLINGAEPFVDKDMNIEEPTNIALEEIAKGFVKVSTETK